MTNLTGSRTPIVTIAPGSDRDRAIFEISLQDHNPAYMSIQRDHYNSCVVLVERTAFLRLLRAGPEGWIVCQSPQELRQHRKYPYAEKGFSYGMSNPVPLADVGCGLHVEQPRRRRFGRSNTRETRAVLHAGFVNGITRTVWLLSHGCTVFPVSCCEMSVTILKIAAGAPRTTWWTTDELCDLDRPIVYRR